MFHQKPREKPIASPPDYKERDVVRFTASSLRRALEDRHLVITHGSPDLVMSDGKGTTIYREDKWGSDHLRSEQLRHYAWLWRWRNISVSIETAPAREYQSNPESFPDGLKRFASVEDYLAYLDGVSDWKARDGLGLVELWRGLCASIPESSGKVISRLYPDRRTPEQIAADTAAEHTEVEPAAEEPPAEPAITTPVVVQVRPSRTDLPPEAVRFLDTGVRP